MYTYTYTYIININKKTNINKRITEITKIDL